MMGDNPALPRMPEKPTLLDFYRLRFGPIARRHHCLSAKLALEAGQDEKVVIACFLHDISNGALVRLRPRLLERAADRAVRERGGGLGGAATTSRCATSPTSRSATNIPRPTGRISARTTSRPNTSAATHDEARAHRWYMTSRMVTMFDIYAFEPGPELDLRMFEDIIGRNFRQPKEGLGFDGSPVAHMWRSMIWPNNFL